MYLSYRLLGKTILMIKNKFLIFSLLFLLAGYNAQCQESMMQNVSYPFLQKLIDSAKAKYPRLRMYTHSAQAAKYDLNKAKMGWFDALTVAYSYGSSTNGVPAGNGGVLPGIYLNMGSVLRNPPAVKYAREKFNASKDDLEGYNLELERLVKEKYFSYVQKLSILNQRTKVANDAETDLKQVKYKFEKGEETFDNFSKMLVIYNTAVQNKITSEGDVLIAKANLEELIVGKLEDVQ